MPFFDELGSNAWVPSKNEVARRWQKKVAEFDGYIFVTAEYNRSVPGALKNAIDQAYSPFVRKAAAYVAYGSVGGARAVEHLRTISVELQMVPVRQGIHFGGSEFAQIMFGKKTWEETAPAFDQFAPDLLDNLVWWTNATKAARAEDAANKAAAE
jgi:NAD(P)H-dependent FMN reductase